MADRTATIEVLHRRYAGVIFDLCLRTLSDRQEAEDAVQETFVSAFRNLSSFTYGDSHLPWLYKIATNVCLKFLRTRRRKGTGSLSHPEYVQAQGPDPVHRIHVSRTLEQLIGELDERGQQILIAHYIAGMDQGQIATSLGISRRAVVKRLSALRKRAGHLLEEGSSHG